MCVQMVLSPSNLRPVLVVVALGCVFAALYFLSRGKGRSMAVEAATLRRRVYAKTGSFVREPSLSNIPGTVQVKNQAWQCDTRADGDKPDQGYVVPPALQATAMNE